MGSLNKDESKRLDARRLVEHPWLLKYRQDRSYVQQWISYKDKRLN